MERDLALRTRQLKKEAMSNIIMQESQQALQYDLQNKALENSMLGIAAETGRAGGQTQLQANQANLQHIQESGSQMLSQVKMQMDEQLSRLGMQIDLTKQQGNMAQYEGNYANQQNQIIIGAVDAAVGRMTDALDVALGAIGM